MIHVASGSLISQPASWLLLFDRRASTPLKSFLAFGRYKHVRAAGYVPFLHVWLFFDPHWSGIDLFVAADGEPAQRVLAAWTETADMMRVPTNLLASTNWSASADVIRVKGHLRTFADIWRHLATFGDIWRHWPLFGFCVPVIKRLVGLRSGALRPDSLWRHCLEHGGEPFEAGNAIRGVAVQPAG